MIYLAQLRLNGGKRQLIAKKAPPASSDNAGGFPDIPTPRKHIRPTMSNGDLQHR
jgi:hypothetical protein